MQRSGGAKKQVRESWCVVAENYRVPNARAPPLILVREAERKAIGRKHGGRLAKIQLLYWLVAEAHRLVYRVIADVKR